MNERPHEKRNTASCKAYLLILGSHTLAKIAINADFCLRISFSIRSKSFTHYEAHIQTSCICPPQAAGRHL